MHPDDGHTEDPPGEDTHSSPPPDLAETDLQRLPDNVGQSGQTGKTSVRYGGGQLQMVTQGRKAIRLKWSPEVHQWAGCFTYLRQWK